jgi:hypothetical protein
LYGINTSYVFNIAELRLSYEGMNYSNEENLKMFVCHAYNISGRNCSGAWESLTATQNKTGEYFNLSSTSFSGFGINETVAAQQPPGGQSSTGGPGGPGGEGGGGLPSAVPAVPAQQPQQPAQPATQPATIQAPQIPNNDLIYLLIALMIIVLGILRKKSKKKK